MNALRAQWQAWSRRFATLQSREKILVVIALAVAVLFGGYSAWIEPGLRQSDQLKKTLAQQQAEQADLQQRLIDPAARKDDPVAAQRAALQRLREELATIEREIGAFGATLVPPQHIPALLQTLLARHRGLTLVSLTTLPPQPLVELPPAGKEGTPAVDAPAAPSGGNLYKHGIEIKLAGGYPELLAYVAELDASPQKLLRGGMTLVVRQHPVSELTLTVYTLSLDPTWLIV